MQANEEIIHKLYTAFSKKDGATMAALYHKDAVFSDPVFPELRGEQIGAMWSMLCLQAATLEIDFSDVQADDQSGQVRWEAKYDFGKPPRKVQNKIRAHFEFVDGQIIKHTDHFSFWKWSRMALGPLGLLLGWNSKVRKKIQHQALSNLEKFILKRKAT